MSLLDRLPDGESWERFYEYKCSLACPKRFTRALRGFIDERRYLPVCERISSGEAFPLPRRNTVLKLLTHLILRKYDGLFAEGLYSFRPARTAQAGFRRLAYCPGIGEMWCYKADISNYFNSVDISFLLPMLEAAVSDDPELYGFLSGLLKEPLVLDRGKAVPDEKGIMAGTPLSAFYANLFLRELDFRFEAEGIPYARYSDDMILFAPTREEAEAYAAEIRSFLTSRGLRLNPVKESLTAPGERWTFLGLSYCGGEIDIAEASLVKLKAKMRRKVRALKRWYGRRGIPPAAAASAFIRIFNRKLFEAGEDNELSWAKWYFPVITTDRSLKAIDAYAQDCLRYLISGKRTKARYNVRYSDLKALGYRSCVHEFYSGVIFPADKI